MPCFRLVNIDSVVFTGRKRARMIDSEMIGREEGKRVQAEAPLLAQLRQSLPGERRSDHDRHVELNRIQRDGIRHVVSVDQRGNQRLVGRSAKGLGQAGNERKTEDVPDVYQSGRHQDGEQRRATPSARTESRAEFCGARCGRPPRRRSARTERWECRREIDRAPSKNAEWLSR